MLWVPEVEYRDDIQADRRAVAKERLARFQDEGLVPRDSTYVLESIVVSLEKEQQKDNVIFTDYSPAMAYLREKIDDLLATVAAFPYKEKFLRVTESWEKVECGFITGFRGDFTSEQNQRRNEELFRELDNSGLSLIKAVGRFAETTTNIFCVINTRFTTRDFIEFMIHLCKKYEQETVLVTVPVSNMERNYRGLLPGEVTVEGRYYDRAGTLAATFNDVTFAQVEAYFARVGGQEFMLVPDQDAGKDDTAYYIKAWHDVYSVHGRCLAEQNFRRLKEGWGSCGSKL
ncbi:MAG: hypothetical protein LBI54_04180 [Lachnospiraceae bacterium]|jgi:hypothetical protein|nr:hypothetical protein [Lachnospiraceae bacterium]